ncbi:VPLPA-CTERM protein sorting domain-containing protein [Desulfacinum hydrothermale DSM 13146]|uniref:VPLPA-CTERM protein sorting domain-containing protein n=2 Tax=Desulfacinum hydrothermale TaxID=109258 RepID=A0A1W1XT80_9BACT|nr:VPLPA-CTERM protein sorting domain-containing protein [Desulfacinum hydrothermale DSM 13146]
MRSVVLACILCLVAVTVAHASIDTQWVATNEDVNQFEIDGDPNTNYDLYIYDGVNTDNHLLINSDYDRIMVEGNKVYSYYDTSKKLDIGSDGMFGWFFDDASDPGINPLNYKYLGRGSNAYNLYIGDEVRLVVDAAPVPLPGSAVLLGSSLLGLVGIGARRKLMAR